MSGLLGLVFEHTRTDGHGREHIVQGRCIGVWGDSGGLTLALEQDDGELVIVSSGLWNRLRIVREGGRRVPL